MSGYSVNNKANIFWKLISPIYLDRYDVEGMTTRNTVFNVQWHMSYSDSIHSTFTFYRADSSFCYIVECYYHKMYCRWYLITIQLSYLRLNKMARLSPIYMTSSNRTIFRVSVHLWGNSPVPGEFPTQRPVTRSSDVYFGLRLNKRLSKQSWGWWFETLSWSLGRRCNEI